MSTAEMVRELERKLLKHCAPTFAGLKPANLFTFRLACKGCAHCHCSPEKVAKREAHFAIALMLCQRKLEPLGVRIAVLAMRTSGPLLYVYRPALLEAALADGRTDAFLAGFGYDASSADACIERLRERIVETEREGERTGTCSFPHEIGLMLGYPYGDVVGFIENRGANYLCAGCWKAYSNERDARACFCRYKNCTACFERYYEAGVPLESLAFVGTRAQAA